MKYNEHTRAQLRGGNMQKITAGCIRFYLFLSRKTDAATKNNKLYLLEYTIPPIAKEASLPWVVTELY